MENKSFDLKKFMGKYILEIVLILIIIFMSTQSKTFLTTGNFLNILRNMSLQGVIAFGMTMVIISGEIDLSIGSTVALTGVIIGLVTGNLYSSFGMPMESAVIIGIIISFIVSAIFGLFIGLIRTKFNVPTFIITLAMLNIVFGLSAVISKGFPITTLPEWYNFIGAGQIGIVPVPAIILLIVFGLVFVVMNYTKFGRAVYAVGGNPESARLSGIDVTKVKIICMMVVQLCATLGGVLVSSQVMSGSFTFGKGWEMTAISSVIIGGASLNGGIGKVWGTFVGLIFLGVIINAMTLMNVNEYVQYIVRGALILIAVLVNTMQTKKTT